LVIAEFSKETTYDEENLLSMSKENIKVVLEKRANDILEREKQVAEEAKDVSCFFRKFCYNQSFFFGLFAINR
jgi:hypothetical protein